MSVRRERRLTAAGRQAPQSGRQPRDRVDADQVNAPDLRVNRSVFSPASDEGSSSRSSGTSVDDALGVTLDGRPSAWGSRACSCRRSTCRSATRQARRTMNPPRNAAQRAAVRGYDPDLFGAGSGAREGDALPVGRPGRRAFAEVALGDLSQVGPVGVHHPDVPVRPIATRWPSRDHATDSTSNPGGVSSRTSLPAGVTTHRCWPRRSRMSPLERAVEPAADATTTSARRGRRKRPRPHCTLRTRAAGLSRLLFDVPRAMAGTPPQPESAPAASRLAAPGRRAHELVSETGSCCRSSSSTCTTSGDSRWDAGLVVAVSSLAELVAGILAGPLIDRVGARRTLAAGLVLQAVGFGLLPLVREPWQAFVLVAIEGAGSAASGRASRRRLPADPHARRHARSQSV